MPRSAVGPPSADGGFGHLRAEFDLPESFPADVLAEAEAVDPDDAGREDATALPFVTIDPPGAKDLDQAMVLSRRGNGFRVHYAIADVGAFVTPGGPVDREARRRGQTIYLPDGAVPLHPPVLSEGATSLLPGEVRAAVLWTVDLDSRGEPTATRVRRAFVRSVEQFDYETVQAALETGTAHPSVTALPELGRLRRQLAVERGAVELQLPEPIVTGDVGAWQLGTRPRNDVEAWNAEISLLTGMAAASIMIEAGIGVLRTLPDPDEASIAWLRRSAQALGIDWPEGKGVAELLAGLDPKRPESMALYTCTTRLLRGAGYTSFAGGLPPSTAHAGIGAPYAHVTAPIRRLVDRFAAEVCLAVTAGRPVPDWVRAALPELPVLMSSSDGLASRVERACIDQVEAWLLAERIGGTFEAVVLRAEEARAEILVEDPPVTGRCAGANLPEGERIPVRLTAVDVTKRKVSFERA
ncbi:VacB/RNase II family 3'-5' exoribonuclease [Amycolatopsis bartoniae]|uniref:Ribonuclease R n=1 Tax=Amycolatopsis bartoniae TaxID=941986 RepID=A0A8H9MFQ0_9PSEU|nr:RNB domain-containing ribonuclease [Amycolatopsis bartoniae]MBB2938822.1 VacB/RNase II family 3'-5' exoribonuclease [Amycolatopsis bartoniae]TVS99578.1 RNB domain-containing ribonuclease [Amycolatopsis bartoniae]GHF89202.1 ribonuclease R [Amycolatopsis bartoniae]